MTKVGYPLPLKVGEVAQLVEHGIENAGVPGSSPGLAIKTTIPCRVFLTNQPHASVQFAFYE